ncbi:MAG: hypothetical protein ONB12_04995 [candidate division KSB1 bacterium]|nr:hypothetical protein [candidate division KSB1 bacterium]
MIVKNEAVNGLVTNGRPAPGLQTAADLSAIPVILQPLDYFGRDLGGETNPFTAAAARLDKAFQCARLKRYLLSPPFLLLSRLTADLLKLITPAIEGDYSRF